MFQAAILPYKQKVRIFEMPPIQLLICKTKASFVPNSKPLPRLADVSTVLWQQELKLKNFSQRRSKKRENVWDKKNHK